MPIGVYKRTEEHRKKSAEILDRVRPKTFYHLAQAREAALVVKHENSRKLNAGIVCKWCGYEEVVRVGFNKRCNPARIRFRCKQCGRYFLEKKDFPFSKKFHSSPDKLLDAIRLMKSGLYTLTETALFSKLDRATIYKLNNYLGRCFFCGCGRQLGHRGCCKQRFDKNPVFQHSWYHKGVGDRKKNRTVEWFAVRTLEKMLKNAIAVTEEKEKENGRRQG